MINFNLLISMYVLMSGEKLVFRKFNVLFSREIDWCYKLFVMIRREKKNCAGNI